jgi:molybdopterin-guanine dinucleotide biosynthesis protein A
MPLRPPTGPALAAVVLAGGQGRRIGGGKAGVLLAGRPLLSHVLGRLSPQLPLVLVNGDPDETALTGCGRVVIGDAVPGRRGPLAGLLAAMNWLASQAPACRHVISVPVDVPWLPPDLVERLATAASAGDGPLIACARSADRLHPVIAAWPLSLRPDLSHAIHDQGLSKVSAWLARHPVQVVDWPAVPFDPFFNINSRDDLAAAEQSLARTAARSSR